MRFNCPDSPFRRLSTIYILPVPLSLLTVFRFHSHHSVNSLTVHNTSPSFHYYYYYRITAGQRKQQCTALIKLVLKLKWLTVKQSKSNNLPRLCFVIKRSLCAISSFQVTHSPTAGIINRFNYSISIKSSALLVILRLWVDSMLKTSSNECIQEENKSERTFAFPFDRWVAWQTCAVSEQAVSESVLAIMGVWVWAKEAIKWISEETLYHKKEKMNFEFWGNCRIGFDVIGFEFRDGNEWIEFNQPFTIEGVSI